MKQVDVVVVGAGPYGLSVAAHLRARGIEHRVFGRTMGTWRGSMPDGMYLRSEGFASNLSDPGDRHTLARYCDERRLDVGGHGSPVPLSVFNDYADWFVEGTGVHVEETEVIELERSAPGFRVCLATGEEVRARRVVLAVGVTHFARVPAELAALPAERCTHSSAHTDLTSFAGRDVVVIGMGQSARELATLLHETGATVRVLARRPTINWDGDPLPEHRPRRERLRQPKAGLGPGWESWWFEHAPASFRLLPASERLRLALTRLGPTGSWWLRPRFEGKVPIFQGRVVRRAEADGAGVTLQVDGPDGREVYTTEHVVAATGYRADLGRLGFLDSTLKAQLRTIGTNPVLGRGFESSVPGLSFVGMTAAPSFGPVFRFVLGTRYAARSLTSHIAR